MVRGSLLKARRQSWLRSAVRKALRGAIPDTQWFASDLQIGCFSGERTTLIQHVLSPAIISAIGTDVEGDSGYPAIAFSLKGLIVVQFTNSGVTTVRIRETRYYTRGLADHTLGFDVNSLETGAAWETGVVAGVGQFYTLEPNSANVKSPYWKWPEAGTPLECWNFWKFYWPFKPRVRYVKPGQTVVFVTKTSNIISQDQLAIAKDSVNSFQPKLNIRAIYEFLAEQGPIVANDNAGTGQYVTARPLAGQVLQRIISKFDYRWGYLNAPDVRGGNQPVVDTEFDVTDPDICGGLVREGRSSYRKALPLNDYAITIDPTISGDITFLNPPVNINFNSDMNNPAFSIPQVDVVP